MIRRMIRAQWIYCDLLTRGKDNWTMYERTIGILIWIVQIGELPRILYIQKLNESIPFRKKNLTLLKNIWYMILDEWKFLSLEFKVTPINMIFLQYCIMTFTVYIFNDATYRDREIFLREIQGNRIARLCPIDLIKPDTIKSFFTKKKM